MLRAVPGLNSLEPVVIRLEPDTVKLLAVPLRVAEQVNRMAQALADDGPVILARLLPEREECDVDFLAELLPVPKVSVSGVISGEQTQGTPNRNLSPS